LEKIVFFRQNNRQRVDGSFEDLLKRAKIEDLRFHDAAPYVRVRVHDERRRSLRALENPWPTERYAKLARQHIAKTRKHGARHLETTGSE
jgi:hypothetical protein